MQTTTARADAPRSPATPAAPSPASRDFPKLNRELTVPFRGVCTSLNTSIPSADADDLKTQNPGNGAGGSDEWS